MTRHELTAFRLEVFRSIVTVFRFAEDGKANATIAVAELATLCAIHGAACREEAKSMQPPPAGKQIDVLETIILSLKPADLSQEIKMYRIEQCVDRIAEMRKAVQA